MYNFNFYNPTRILFGKNQIQELENLVPENSNILITYGGGSIKRSGLLDKVKEYLGDRRIFEFGGIEPNPRFETLMKAATLVKNEKIDFILAVGGGSVIDGTKFISLASHFEGDAKQLLGFGFSLITGAVVKKVVPFGTVLTLPATGSEMNHGAVISYGHGKHAVMSELSFPVFSILDPVYTFTLPKIQVANGIVDAFIHTTEQYITLPVDARIQDRMAEGILQTLIEIGPESVAGNDNYGTRANHMWAATVALNGIIGIGVPVDWATHMIGHELTALFGIDHGQTLAIVYPAMLKVRKEQKQAKLLQFAERVWNLTDGSEEEKIQLAISKTEEFFESLGIKTRLSGYGIKADQIDQVVDQLISHGMVSLSETRDLTPEISRKILEMAL